MEEWKQIENHPNYEISSLGRVRHRKFRHIRKTSLDKRGYPRTTLDGKTERVHRLVAKAFLNQGSYTEVNHIDENKEHNTVDNLEWCSKAYNYEYGTRLIRQAFSNRNNTQSYRILVEKDGFSKEYPSIGECYRDLHIPRSSISKALNGQLVNNKPQGYTITRLR